MSLILATGSNISNPVENLKSARDLLKSEFNFIAESQIYTSKAIEYTNQPDFFNQMLEFKLPSSSPDEVLEQVFSIEKELGRVRNISKGPRTIDIDIIFWGLDNFTSPKVTIPHPAWNQRSFVVLPLKELPFFQTLKNHFIIPTEFTNSAKPI